MTIRMVAIDMSDDHWDVLDDYNSYGTGRTTEDFVSEQMVRRVETIKFNQTKAEKRKRVQG